MVIRLAEAASDLRAAVFGVSFDGQIQLYRRQVALDLELAAPLRPMKDVETAPRLGGVGACDHLWQGNKVSERSWRKGPGNRILLVFRLFFSYLLNRLYGTPDTHHMFERYYGLAGNAKSRRKRNAPSS